MFWIILVCTFLIVSLSVIRINHTLGLSFKYHFPSLSVLNHPEDYKKSLEREIMLSPQNKNKRHILALICNQLKDYQCAKTQYIWLINNHPKEEYFLNYLDVQMKVNNNLLNQDDRKLLVAILSRNFSSMLAHKIAAKDAMQQHHYSKAVMHWRYVYDHLL